MRKGLRELEGRAVLYSFQRSAVLNAASVWSRSLKGSGEMFSEAHEIEKLFIVILENPWPFSILMLCGCAWELAQM